MDHFAQSMQMDTRYINDFNISDNNDLEDGMLMVNSSTNSFGISTVMLRHPL